MRPPRRTAVIGIAVIVILTTLAYAPSRHGEFIIDDDMYITANPLIQAADGPYRFWCTSEATDYWPVFFTTLWFEWRAWGANPTGYHAINVLLHIGTALLIWAILARLSIPGAWLAGMLFAVHPVNVESVAWIAQLKNVLALLFYLLSIFCFVRSEELTPSQPGRPVSDRWHLLCIATFAAAMLSKGSVAFLPVVLLGITWSRRRPTVRDVLRLGPLLLISAVLVPVNVWFNARIVASDTPHLSLPQRLLGAGAVVWFYLSKALLPVRLSFFYPRWDMDPERVLWWLPLFAALGVTGILWWHRRRWQPLWMAWAYFAVCLVPIMGFVETGFMQYALVADHYQHVALIGVVALVAAYWQRWNNDAPARWLPRMVAAAVVVTLAGLTWRQNALYADQVTLYRATLQMNPGAWALHNNLAVILANTGHTAEAADHFEQALQLKPTYADAHNNYSNVLRNSGRLTEAIEHGQRALQLQPTFPDAHYNLAITFTQAGQLDDAIAHYEEAIRQRPEFADAHFNLGLVLARVGRFDGAITEYRKAVQLAPQLAAAHYSLGVALIQAGQAEAALAPLRRALQINPAYAEAHNDLGVALVNTGALQEAITHFDRALELKPGFHDAQVNRDVAVAMRDAHRE